MKYINNQDISNLNISPSQCIDWVEESLMIKNECQLPVKVPIHPQGTDFITTMPCLLNPDSRAFGVKVVSRIEGRKPALKSSLTLYDSVNGEVVALMDSDWITSMRTGAMAALAIRTLRKESAKTYSLMGLGDIARSTMKCLGTILRQDDMVRLLRYKDQAERFQSEFPGIKFEFAESIDELVDDADVLISAITSANGFIVDNPAKFKPGCLLVPVHTRGFQNCDILFDKIIGDDYGHIKGFQYFNQFKYFAELSQVLKNEKPGRKNSSERIIAYNYGLALHDVYFAYKIYNKMNTSILPPPQP